jgi:hypothetical protein
MTSADPTYDERRANPQTCQCGLRVTRPDYCAAQRRCLFGRIPSWAPDIFHRGQPDANWGME